MLSGVFLNLFVIATGFTTAGLLASSIQLMTGRPLGFTMARETFTYESVLAILTRVVAGPVILLRNAIRGRKIEGRAFHWLVLSSMIAATWSFFSGVVVIEAFIALSHSLQGSAL